MEALTLTESTTHPRVFTSTIEVGSDDIDQLGHANNIAYLRWVQDVAVAHSSAVGLDVAAYQRMGGVFVVRRHEIDYLRPVLRGETLELRTWIDSVFAAKCRRATAIVRVGSGGADTIVARAMTTWGFIEIATGRPTRIPNDIRLAFGESPLRSSQSA
ncbi:MAG: acyl-CoA thioesterase [Polyangiaceae bacterium]|nr:acyl-CoA thioesterase [Polyangiaceae bacterium]